MADSIEKSTIAWFGGLLLGAVTTTATVVHMLHDQFITPMKVFESNQAVKKLTAELDAQSDMANELTKTKKKLEQSQRKLAQIEYSELFTKNNIYPATLDTAKLGQNIAEVYEIHDRNKISSQDETSLRPVLIVDLENSVFYTIRYGYDPKTKLIQSIGLSLSYEKELGDRFLELAVGKALGSPTAVGDKGQFRWKTSQGASAYVMDRTYLLLKNGYIPRMWGGDRNE